VEKQRVEDTNIVDRPKDTSKQAAVLVDDGLEETNVDGM
jgi:hypothetical protein